MVKLLDQEQKMKIDNMRVLSKFENLNNIYNGQIQKNDCKFKLLPLKVYKKTFDLIFNLSNI